MWKAIILAAVAAVSFVEGCTYKQSECPDYTVVEQHSDYEVRSYSAITWATTSVMSRYRRVGHYSTFMRLFRYINGQNDREQSMAMTVPVRMQTTDAGNQTLFDMSFVVPAEFANDPPVPNDDRVEILRENATLYAVRTFKGYIWRQSQWKEEAQKLADSVKDDETVVKTSYYQVGYDAPFDLFDRRNEIWMVKIDKQETNEV